VPAYCSCVQIKNYTAFDQYVHRYPAAALDDCSIPATKLSIPLSRLTIEVVSAKDVNLSPLMMDEMAANCCDFTPVGSVVALKVGDGVKVTVACVDVGPHSNAEAFVKEVHAAQRLGVAETPQLAAFFAQWFQQRLSMSGRMAGSAPRPVSMERPMPNLKWPQRAGGQVAPFVKCVGPLPNDLHIAKNRMNYNKIQAVGGIGVTKQGKLYTPHHSALVDQLNAGDTILAINGVQRTGNADHQWLDQVVATGNANPHMPKYMEVSTTMPYFVPNHVVTVSVPAQSIGMLGLIDGTATPPQIGEPTPTAQGYGLFKNDAIVSATIDGMLLETNALTSADLIKSAMSAQSPVSLTVLQTSRVTSLSHDHSWPIGNGNVK
jgi:hypothetical protein